MTYDEAIQLPAVDWDMIGRIQSDETFFLTDDERCTMLNTTVGKFLVISRDVLYVLSPTIFRTPLVIEPLLVCLQAFPTNWDDVPQQKPGESKQDFLDRVNAAPSLTFPVASFKG